MSKIAVFLRQAMPMLTLLSISSCSHKGAGDRESEHVPEINVAMPRTDSIVIRKSFPATLEATKSVEVVARVDGYVTGKKFSDGDYVHQGQVLYTIENTSYADAVAQAEAALSTARSQADYATRQYDAMKRALESDAVSKMDVVQAENAMNTALASVKNAAAALQTARTNLAYCTVKALSNGHISAGTVDVGDYVGGSMSPVVMAKIYDDSSLYANFSINDGRYMSILSDDGGRVFDLDSIPVTFGEGMLQGYVGSLDYVAPEIDRSTGTMPLRLRLDNKKGELKPGMYCEIHLPIEVDSHAMLIEDAAISTDQRGRYVYVVNDSNRVVYTPVEVGDLYADTLRVVNGGLTLQSRYVTKALLKVHDGMRVKPIM